MLLLNNLQASIHSHILGQLNIHCDAIMDVHASSSLSLERAHFKSATEYIVAN